MSEESKRRMAIIVIAKQEGLQTIEIVKKIGESDPSFKEKYPLAYEYLDQGKIFKGMSKEAVDALSRKERRTYQELKKVCNLVDIYYSRALKLLREEVLGEED